MTTTAHGFDRKLLTAEAVSAAPAFSDLSESDDLRSAITDTVAQLYPESHERDHRLSDVIDSDRYNEMVSDLQWSAVLVGIAIGMRLGGVR